MPLRPWGLRPFAPAELDRLAPADSGHPWSGRYAAGRRSARLQLDVLSPAVGSLLNTGAPYSLNDGAVWVGRGATVVGRGGMQLRYRGLTVRLEPVAFWTTNGSFDLLANGETGRLRFADGLEPYSVDLPQRFGDGSYGRIDPGESTVRVDGFGVAAGVSTASQYWGPALQDPLILGDNAGGIPHAFVGTARPINIGIGTLHARLEAGRLDQSAYSFMQGDSSVRQMAGLVVVGTIRGVPGLELGGTRFYHRLWGDGISLETFKIPFEGVFKESLGETAKDSLAENQLGSVFGRWVFPRGGVEVWGEYGRNDHSLDGRDFLLEPDHNSAWVLGARHVRRRGANGMLALRVETLNAQVTHLARVRGQSRFYQHAQLRQGHTQRGQLLGSSSGLGGAATTLGADLFVPDGRWSFEYARRVRQARLGEGAPSDEWDVENLLRVERLRFGRAADLVFGLTAVAQLNQNFARDGYGVRVDLAWRPNLHPRR